MNHGRFIGKFDLQPDPADWRLWILQNPVGPDHWGYVTSTGRVISPPDGMRTDLGSIWRPLTSLFPREEFKEPYVIHDWGYWLHDLTIEELCEELKKVFPQLSWDELVRQAHGLKSITRAEWDSILREAIAANGGAAWRRETIYAHVRMWGWIPWKLKEQKADRRRLKRKEAPMRRDLAGLETGGKGG